MADSGVYTAPDYDKLNREMNVKLDAQIADIGRGISRLQVENVALTEALVRLLFVIKAAGLSNLVNGVQLGQTSWFVKASDAVEQAESALKLARKS